MKTNKDAPCGDCSEGLKLKQAVGVYFYFKMRRKGAENV